VERGLKIVSGGTDNHLMLVDLGERLSGKDAEEALGRAHITVNKNTVPGEQRSPMVTSGIRIGTPAMTTRGLGRADSVVVANLIADLLAHPDDTATVERVGRSVHDLCAKYPVYPADLMA
jgi:glycine hydroxymethyltransferase